MARIDSKQLNQKFTGSFTLSGSFLGDSNTSASFGRIVGTTFVGDGSQLTDLISVSDTAPSNPVQGDLWWKSDDGNMYVYYDGYWVISIDTTTIIPSGTVSGSSQITDVVTQTYVSSSAAAAGFGSGGNFSLLDLETAVVDSNTTSILDITFITDSNGDLIKSSG